MTCACRRLDRRTGRGAQCCDVRCSFSGKRRPDSDDAVAICARQGANTPRWTWAGSSTTSGRHPMARRCDHGSDGRTDIATKAADVASKAVRPNASRLLGNAETSARNLLVHCAREMNHLAGSCPSSTPPSARVAFCQTISRAAVGAGPRVNAVRRVHRAAVNSSLPSPSASESASASSPGNCSDERWWRPPTRRWAWRRVLHATMRSGQRRSDLRGRRLTWSSGRRRQNSRSPMSPWGAFERKSYLLNLFEHLTRGSQWLRGVVDDPRYERRHQRADPASRRPGRLRNRRDQRCSGFVMGLHLGTRLDLRRQVVHVMGSRIGCARG